jgi:hypothetical protein
MADAHRNQTFHGVPIPEDVAQDWTDPNSTEAAAWRRGVTDAKAPRSKADRMERKRLDLIFEAADDEDQRAWREQYTRDMAAYEERKHG